jgi:hypothetical protein
MAKKEAPDEPRGMTISATVIRADGSVEELGTIAEGTVQMAPGTGDEEG